MFEVNKAIMCSAADGVSGFNSIVEVVVLTRNRLQAGKKGQMQ